MAVSSVIEAKENRSNLLSSRIIIFVVFLDLFIQFPIVAPYAKQLGASPTFVGIIMAAYSATNLVGNIFSGLLLDRIGRRLPILIGALVTSASLLGYALANTANTLFIARIFHGLASSSLTPGSFALIGDASTKDSRANVMGVSAAFIAIAAIVGPMFAGIVTDKFSQQPVFVSAAIMMLIAVTVFWYFSTETIEKITPSNNKGSQNGRGTKSLEMINRFDLITSSMSVLAFTVGLGTLVTHLPISLDVLGLSASKSGTVFTIYAIVAMIVMISPLRKLSDTYGRLPFIILGLLLISFGLFLLSLVSEFSGIILGMAVYGLGFGVLFPATTALVADSAPLPKRGFAFGIFYGVYSGGVIIGSLLSGYLAEIFGPLTRSPFAVSSVIVFSVCILGFVYYLKQRKYSQI